MQSEHKEDAARELQHSDERSVEAWKWNVEAREKCRDPGQVVKLTPACLGKLKSPIEPDGQQHGRLQ
jgi:hypothetical protein